MQCFKVDKVAKLVYTKINRLNSSHAKIYKLRLCFVLKKPGCRLITLNPETPHLLTVLPRTREAHFLRSTSMKWVVKSVSIRKPGRTRQEVIQLKSPISLKLGTNVGFGE